MNNRQGLSIFYIHLSEISYNIKKIFVNVKINIHEKNPGYIWFHCEINIYGKMKNKNTTHKSSLFS